MRRLALLLVVAAVLLPACGEEDTPDGASPNGAGTGGGEVVEVALSEFALEPASFSLEPGSSPTPATRISTSNGLSESVKI